MTTEKTEMKTKKIVLEIPERAKAKDVRLLVERFFSFDIRRIYGKDKNFPLVRIKWQASV